MDGRGEMSPFRTYRQLASLPVRRLALRACFLSAVRRHVNYLLCIIRHAPLRCFLGL